VQDLEFVIAIIQKAAKDNNMTVNKMLIESGAGKDLIADMKKGERLP